MRSFQNLNYPNFFLTAYFEKWKFYSEIEIVVTEGDIEGDIVADKFVVVLAADNVVLAEGDIDGDVVADNVVVADNFVVADNAVVADGDHCIYYFGRSWVGNPLKADQAANPIQKQSPDHHISDHSSMI